MAIYKILVRKHDPENSEDDSGWLSIYASQHNYVDTEDEAVERFIRGWRNRLTETVPAANDPVRSAVEHIIAIFAAEDIDARPWELDLYAECAALYEARTEGS